MYDSVDEGMLDGIRNALNNLMILKYIEDCGFALDDKMAYYLGTDEDYYQMQEQFLDTILDAVCGAGNTSWTQATKENGEILGYELFYDEDEMTIYELIIKPPVIVEYLDWLKASGVSYESDRQLVRLTDALLSSISNRWATDYEYYETFIAQDGSGICMVITDFLFVDKWFADGLMDLIKYCKQQLTKREESGEWHE